MEIHRILRRAKPCPDYEFVVVIFNQTRHAKQYCRHFVIAEVTNGNRKLRHVNRWGIIVDMHKEKTTTTDSATRKLEVPGV